MVLERLITDEPKILVVLLRPRLDPQPVRDRPVGDRVAERMLHVLVVTDRREALGTQQLRHAGDVLVLLDVDHELQRRVVQRVQYLRRRHPGLHERGADTPAAVVGVDPAVQEDPMNLLRGRLVPGLHVAHHHVAVEGGEACALQVRVGVDQLLKGVLLVIVLADPVHGLDGVEEVGR